MVSHKEYMKNYMRDWRKRNPELSRANCKRYNDKNKEERNKNCRKRLRLKRKELREKIIFHYAGNPPKCACEGCYYHINDCPIDFLTIDHVHGGGGKDKKIFNAQISLYSWIIKNNFPSDFQVLCMNCNFAKGKLGYCPHNNKPEDKSNDEELFISYEKVQNDCYRLADFLRTKVIDGIVPIPRGGIIPATILSHILNKPLKIKVTSKNDVIVDEIVDSGLTMKTAKKEYPENIFVSLYLNSKHFKLRKIKPDYYVEPVDKWCVFEWEKNGK